MCQMETHNQERIQNWVVFQWDKSRPKINSSNPTFVEESDSEMRLDVSGKQKSAIPFFLV